MTGVKVVAPANMGERLEYNAQTKKYDVNVSDILQTLTAHDKRLNALEGKENGSIKFDSSSDLNQAIPKYGFSIMHGFGYVRGVPRNIYSTAYKQPAALSLSEYSGAASGSPNDDVGIDRPNQDWTGWQIANTSEIVQFIQEEFRGSSHPVNIWCRINAGGLIERDGQVVIANADAWTDWVRVTNIA